MKDIFLGLLGFLVAAACLVWLLAVPIDLTTQDLGRHVENGRLVITQGLFNNQVLTQNTYSYTHPNFSSINHHWLSGVFYYLVLSAFSFNILQILHIGMLVVALALLWYMVQMRFGLWPTLLSVFITLPLLAFRKEVRPETISVLFFWLLVFIWHKVDNLSWQRRALWLTPFLMAIWANSHIYFFLGFGVIVAYIIQWFFQKERAVARFGLGVLAASLFAVMVNPGFIQGAVYPLLIFKEYGYRVAENQTVWFLWNLGINNPGYILFAWLSGMVGLLLVIMLIFRRHLPLAWFILAIGGLIMGLFAIRNIAFFAFLAIPVLAAGLALAAWQVKKINPRLWQLFAPSLVIILFVSICAIHALNYKSIFTVSLKQAGIGLVSGNTASLEFLQKNIKGPIFNNYDIGGYLIYALHPKEKVFVDNRPESYPVEFFKNEYIPMQEQSIRFYEADKRWRFNAIVFAWHDLTPWAQNFLKERVKDPEWVPVYVDAYVLVLVRNNQLNSEVIKQYALPRGMFK